MTEIKVEDQVVESAVIIEEDESGAELIPSEVISIHPEIDKNISVKRFLAKKIDLTICTYVVAIMMMVFGKPGHRGIIVNLLMGCVIVVLLIPVEALLISKWGTTIGKNLMNIKMTTQENGRIPLGVALKRSGQAGVKGMGLGLPVVTLVTCCMAFDYLTSNGTVRWDEECAVKVTYKKLGVIRMIITIIICALIFGSYLLAMS